MIPTTYLDNTRTYADGHVETKRYVWSGLTPEDAYRRQLERRRSLRGFISTDPATRTITTREYAAARDDRVDWVSVVTFTDANEPEQQALPTEADHG